MKVTASLLLMLAVISTSTVSVSAAQTLLASGSFMDTAVLGSSVTVVGTNAVYRQANAGFITGTLSGKYVTLVNLTLDLLTGNAVYSAIDICTCTVAGKSGTLYFYEQGTINQFVTLSSTATIEKGTGQLVNRQGTIALQGLVYNQQGLTMGTYIGRVWLGTGSSSTNP